MASVSAHGRTRLSRRPSAGPAAPNTQARSLTICAGAAGLTGLGARRLRGPLILPVLASSWNAILSGVFLLFASA
jgi:hypothetical protein